MNRKKTYVWFSPLGARIHAAAQKMAVTTRPMKGAQLEQVSCVEVRVSGQCVCARRMRTRWPFWSVRVWVWVCGFEERLGRLEGLLGDDAAVEWVACLLACLLACCELLDCR